MSRRLLVAAAFVALVGSPWFSNPAHAQNSSDGEARAMAPRLASSLLQPLRMAETSQLPMTLQQPRQSARLEGSRIGSRTLLTSLYASTAAMQMLDVHSTFKAMDRGAIEANPLMSGLVKNRAAFVTTKAAVAAATIYASSRIAKTNRVAAIVTMVAMNSAYAMIVSNNYKIAGR
jgi:hypothetical protein